MGERFVCQVHRRMPAVLCKLTVNDFSCLSFLLSYSLKFNELLSIPKLTMRSFRYSLLVFLLLNFNLSCIYKITILSSSISNASRSVKLKIQVKRFTVSSKVSRNLISLQDDQLKFCMYHRGRKYFFIFLFWSYLSALFAGEEFIKTVNQ